MRLSSGAAMILFEESGTSFVECIANYKKRLLLLLLLILLLLLLLLLLLIWETHVIIHLRKLYRLVCFPRN